MGDKLLTVRETADRMHVSTQTVYNWVKDGRLKAVRVGRTLRIDPQTLPQPSARDELAAVLAAANLQRPGDPLALLDELLARVERLEAKVAAHI